jgi:hypothetical protein
MTSEDHATRSEKSAAEELRPPLSLLDVLDNADGTLLLDLIDRRFNAAARKASEESHALGLEVLDGRKGGACIAERRLERALQKAAQQPEDEKGLKGLRRRQAERRRRNFIFAHVDFSKVTIRFGDAIPTL